MKHWTFGLLLSALLLTAGLLLSGLLKAVLDTEPLKGLVGGGAAQAQGVPAQRAEEGHRLP